MTFMIWAVSTCHDHEEDCAYRTTAAGQVDDQLHSVALLACGARARKTSAKAHATGIS